MKARRWIAVLVALVAAPLIGRAAEVDTQFIFGSRWAPMSANSAKKRASWNLSAGLASAMDRIWRSKASSGPKPHRPQTFASR
jgi:hypothetical protein